MNATCHAHNDASYRKPHFYVQGLYDGKPRMSCKYCGAWCDEVESETAKALQSALAVGG